MFPKQHQTIIEAGTNSSESAVIPLLGGPKVFAFEVENLCASALATFHVEARVHPEGSFVPWVTSANFASGVANSKIVHVGDVMPYATSSEGVTIQAIRTEGLEALKFVCTTADGEGDVVIRATSY